jgi:SRSO17 transposase
MAGVARGVVLTDAAYGSDGAFRAGVTEIAPSYVAAAARRGHGGTVG